jgi:hypothetical protein
MVPRDFLLNLVFTMAYLLYFRFPLFVDTCFHSQLSGVFNGLNEFIEKYGWKVSSSGLDLQTARFLKMDYERLKVFGDKFIQTKVNTVILGLLPNLFSPNVIKTFTQEDVSELLLLEFKKIEKNNVYNQVIAKMNEFVKHCDSPFGVLERELKKLNSFFSHGPVVQPPLNTIQKIFTETKKDLTSIKDKFQTQISYGLVDLCYCLEKFFIVRRPLLSEKHSSTSFG